MQDIEALRHLADRLEIRAATLTSAYRGIYARVVDQMREAAEQVHEVVSTGAP